MADAEQRERFLRLLHGIGFALLVGHPRGRDRVSLRGGRRRGAASAVRERAARARSRRSPRLVGRARDDRGCGAVRRSRSAFPARAVTSRSRACRSRVGHLRSSVSCSPPSRRSRSAPCSARRRRCSLWASGSGCRRRGARTTTCARWRVSRVRARCWRWCSATRSPAGSCFSKLLARRLPRRFSHRFSVGRSGSRSSPASGRSRVCRHRA